MDIPSSVGQLAIAPFLVTPGVVYQVTRSRLRGPTPDDASATNPILRALAFSAVLNGIYAIVAGPDLYRLVSDSRTHLLRAKMWTRLLTAIMIGTPLLVRAQSS